MPPKVLLFLALSASAALLHTPKVIARRDIVFLALGPALGPTACRAEASPTAGPLPRDFDVLPEASRPFNHYLENAERLASNLVCYADGADLSIGEALDGEITAFAAVYAPRPGALIDAGPTPGLSELKTAYDALAYHFARYRGASNAEPLPEALAGTVRRNALAAQNRIKKIRAAQEAAKGVWPTCRGVPLGYRDSQCSTQEM